MATEPQPGHDRPGERRGPGRRLSRRDILGGAAALGASAALAPLRAVGAAAQSTGGTSTPPGNTVEHTAAATATSGKTAKGGDGQGILVLVTLYGGNDGLDTVIPAGDGAYQAARGALAKQPNDVLGLDGPFGLHPALPGLKALWDAKQLAIVHGVGYPNPNRSHFRSMDIWQTAAPDRFVPTGWLGRWHDASGPDPLRMVAIGSSLPRAMLGLKGSGAVLPTGRIGLPGNAALEQAFTELNRAGAGADLGPWGARIAGSGADLLRVNQVFGPLVTSAAATTGAGGTSLEGGTTANGTDTATRNELEVQLDEVTALIRGGAPTRAFSVSLGGFDTHAAEGATHARLLATVDRAVAGFLRAMAADPKGAGVAVVVYSEFGRRVAANLSAGTDHGTAAPVLVAGLQVRGGHHGTAPSLTDLDQGDLKATTDFRSVYATLLERVLGFDAAAVLDGSFPPVPFL